MATRPLSAVNAQLKGAEMQNADSELVSWSLGSTLWEIQALELWLFQFLGLSSTAGKC